MAMANQGIVNITNSHDGYIKNFLIFDHFTEKLVIVGSKEGELALPCGIATHDKDHIHTSEASLQKISVFTCGGELIHCFRLITKMKAQMAKKSVLLNYGNLPSINRNGNLFASYIRKDN